MKRSQSHVSVDVACDVCKEPTQPPRRIFLRFRHRTILLAETVLKFPPEIPFTELNIRSVYYDVRRGIGRGEGTIFVHVFKVEVERITRKLLSKEIPLVKEKNPGCMLCISRVRLCKGEDGSMRKVGTDLVGGR